MDEALHTIVIVDIHPTEPTSKKKPHESHAFCTCGAGWMWEFSHEIKSKVEEHAAIDHDNKVNIVRYS